VAGVEVLGVRDLQEAVEVLRGDRSPAPLAGAPPAGVDPDLPDLSDVRGHNGLIPALSVAAAGGHNLFLHGPPGTGKTMLARRLPSLLPPLAPHEAIEVTRLHSIAGLAGAGLIEQRPFRSPHHTISASGLVGGGAQPVPGEATLAHHGVLFLDELSEFTRPALEALRQPLEDGHVTIVRAQRVMTFPTRLTLVAASNPCPCGLGERACRCSAVDLARHRRRLSGPLLDRIDISVTVARPTAEAMRTQAAPASAEVRPQILAARERQLARLTGTGLSCNAQLTARLLRELSGATPEAERLLYELHDRNQLSARGHGRILRVARTVADLAGSAAVAPEHILRAASLRLDDHALELAA
jgi:magnesium chelatase family protein